MSAEDIKKVVSRSPFQPFRVTLETGEVIEIKRTLRTTVWIDRVIFGTNEDPETGQARRMRMIPLTQIKSAELLSA